MHPHCCVYRERAPKCAVPSLQNKSLIFDCHADAQVENAVSRMWTGGTRIHAIQLEWTTVGFPYLWWSCKLTQWCQQSSLLHSLCCSLWSCLSLLSTWVIQWGYFWPIPAWTQLLHINPEFFSHHGFAQFPVCYCSHSSATHSTQTILLILICADSRWALKMKLSIITGDICMKGRRACKWRSSYVSSS